MRAPTERFGRPGSLDRAARIVRCAGWVCGMALRDGVPGWRYGVALEADAASPEVVPSLVVSAARRAASVPGEAPMASRPMSAAPSTGGASRRTSSACGAAAEMPAAIRRWKAASVVSKMPPPRTTSTASAWRSRRRERAADEGHDFVGQEVRRFASEWVAVGGRVEEDPCQLEEPVVGDGARVDAGQHGLGVGLAEIRGNPLAERGRRPASVAGPQRQAQRAHAEPRAARREVAGELRQCREADRPAVGADARTVDAGAADHADAPGRRGPGP